MKDLAILGGEKTVTLPLPPKWPIITKAQISAVTKLLEKGEVFYYDRGPMYVKFEDTFAKYHNTKYALLTNSGTSALHSAFFGVKIGPGDEVLVPTYTFLATVTPILLCKAVPVFCDSEPDTGNIDPKEIRKRLTPQVKAMVVTHIWGHPAEMDGIVDIAGKNGLALIEDCSHAHGAEYKGKKVGNFGDAGAFSLGASKMISAGLGGILITNKQEVYERAILLGHFRERARECVKSKFYHQFVDTGYGANYRIHPLGVAMAYEQLKTLDKRIKIKRENLDYLSEKLLGIPGIKPPITRKYVTRGAYYGYKLHYCPEELGGLNKDLYIRALQAEGVPIHQPNSKPLHLLPLFQTLNDGMYNFGCPRCCPYVKRKRVYKKGDFPISEAYYESSLSLPAFYLSVPAKSLLAQYVMAFEKVAQGYKRLLSQLQKSYKGSNIIYTKSE